MSRDYWTQFFNAASIEEQFVSQYANIFVTHKITPKNLHLLNHYFLFTMGIKLVGHVVTILDFIQKQTTKAEESWEKHDKNSTRPLQRPRRNSDPSSSRPLKKEDTFIERRCDISGSKSPSPTLFDPSLNFEKPSEDANSFQGSGKYYFNQYWSNHQGKGYFEQNQPKLGGTCIHPIRSEKNYFKPNRKHTPYVDIDKPSCESGHEVYFWKRSQSEDKLDTRQVIPIQNVQDENSKKESSLEPPVMEYLKHRSHSLQMEIQAEMDVISRRRPIPPLTSKSCLKVERMSDSLEVMKSGGEEKVGKVRFCPGGPEVKLVPARAKVPQFHAWKDSEEEYKFPSLLRRDLCLSLATARHLKELTCTFSPIREHHFEKWPKSFDSCQ